MGINIIEKLFEEFTTIIKKSVSEQEYSEKEFREDFVRFADQTEKMLLAYNYNNAGKLKILTLIDNKMEELIPDEWRTRDWFTTPHTPQDREFMRVYANVKDALEDLGLEMSHQSRPDDAITLGSGNTIDLRDQKSEPAPDTKTGPDPEDTEEIKLTYGIAKDPKAGTVELLPLNDDNCITIRSTEEAIFLIKEIADFTYKE